MEIDQETAWATRAIEAANGFALACRDLCDKNPGQLPQPLSEILNDVMTELWDQGFSQTEIRNAFMDAVGDLDRYAAGEERRS